MVTGPIQRSDKDLITSLRARIYRLEHNNSNLCNKWRTKQYKAKCSLDLIIEYLQTKNIDIEDLNEDNHLTTKNITVYEFQVFLDRLIDEPNAFY